MSEEAINAVGDYRYGFHDPENRLLDSIKVFPSKWLEIYRV